MGRAWSEEAVRWCGGKEKAFSFAPTRDWKNLMLAVVLTTRRPQTDLNRLARILRCPFYMYYLHISTQTSDGGSLGIFFLFFRFFFPLKL